MIDLANSARGAERIQSVNNVMGVGGKLSTNCHILPGVVDYIKIVVTKGGRGSKNHHSCLLARLAAAAVVGSSL